ncbi:MAG: Flp family type IVb pilin [Alphaproteobacteria bacterium]|nr:Flp family type IVb pilin [Alphaproteobacteria bacterium]MBL7098496.1 Flp family type IVb pilin [Alphaproteobacteria bacterium]
MGKAARAFAVSHAAGRLAAYSDAARSALKRFAADRSGATAIEYALIAAFISIMIVAGVTTVGTTLKSFFNSISF